MKLNILNIKSGIVSTVVTAAAFPSMLLAHEEEVGIIAIVKENIAIGVFVITSIGFLILFKFYKKKK